MTQFVRDNLAELDASGKQALQDLIVALSAEAQLTPQRDADRQSTGAGVVERGKEALTGQFGCTDCHRFHDAGDLGTAPDLTGYGSLAWLEGIISNPAHEAYYADRNDRMPGFAADKEDPSRNVLTAEQIRLLAQWLRGDLRDLNLVSANLSSQHQ
jgi:ubiquinol-cytochrome c reductase cytochrome b subunit